MMISLWSRVAQDKAQWQAEQESLENFINFITVPTSSIMIISFLQYNQWNFIPVYLIGPIKVA